MIDLRWRVVMTILSIIASLVRIVEKLLPETPAVPGEAVSLKIVAGEPTERTRKP